GPRTGGEARDGGPPRGYLFAGRGVLRDAHGRVAAGQVPGALKEGAGGCAPGRSGAARAGKRAGAPLPAGERGEDSPGGDHRDAQRTAPAGIIGRTGRGNPRASPPMTRVPPPTRLRRRPLALKLNPARRRVLGCFRWNSVNPPQPLADRRLTSPYPHRI